MSKSKVTSPNVRLVLASSSPRRKDLLGSLGLQFDVVASDIEEIIDPSLDPQRLVLKLAEQKTQDVFARLCKQERKERLLVLGADTIVVFEGRYLGKPVNEEDACRMLRILSGRWHEVYTGVFLKVADEANSIYERQCCERSRVYFRRLEEKEILAYVKTGEPMDKAGAYALQGIGSALVERIEGSPTNIIGLPIPNVVSLLRESGYGILGMP